ncbi:MAG: hypothetical protein Salg2KO_11050 [Salibacteraceae bacterium]
MDDVITCKQATEYCQKSEEKKLNLKERFQLWFHLTMCKVCKVCSEQSYWIAEVSRKLKIEDRLTEQEKLELKQALDSKTK